MTPYVQTSRHRVVDELWYAPPSFGLPVEEGLDCSTNFSAAHLVSYLMDFKHFYQHNLTVRVGYYHTSSITQHNEVTMYK
jgi:hypothetical protein